MTTLIVMLAIAAPIAALAWFWQRNQHRPAPTGVVGQAPTQLDRRDFSSPDVPMLIAVFTSATCSSCAGVLRELRAYENETTILHDVEVDADAALHQRYRIESVPLTVIADSSGQVHHAIIGPIGPDDRTRLAEVMQPRA